MTPPNVNMAFASSGAAKPGTGGGTECSGSVMATYMDGVYHTIATLPAVRNPTILEVRAVGRRVDSVDCGGYIRRAVVGRGAAGTAVILSSFDSPLTRESASVWDVRLITSGAFIQVQVRGAAGATVDWRVSWIFNSISGYGLLTTNGVYQPIQVIAIPDDTVCQIEALVVGIRTDAPGSAGYVHRAVIYREGGGNATLQTTVDSNLTRETVPGWDSTIIVAGNNAVIEVCGATGQTVSWKSDYALEELGI